MAFNWKCPYCGNNATVGDGNCSVETHSFELGNYLGERIGVQTIVIVCPNGDCRQVSLDVSMGHVVFKNGYPHLTDVIIDTWKLLPFSEALVFPDYVPKSVRDDYEEACKIKSLSPKASATLSRRCLQGLIRDFWQVSKPTLFREIEEIRDRIDPDTWAAIDAVRQIGNIGAHMEKDINVIIEVDSEEAQLLIGLIEMLIKDWYVARHKRQEHLRQIVAAAEAKKT